MDVRHEVVGELLQRQVPGEDAARGGLDGGGEEAEDVLHAAGHVGLDDFHGGGERLLDLLGGGGDGRYVDVDVVVDADGDWAGGVGVVDVVAG